MTFGNWHAATGPLRSCLKKVGWRSRLRLVGGCGLTTPTLTRIGKLAEVDGPRHVCIAVAEQKGDLIDALTR